MIAGPGHQICPSIQNLQHRRHRRIAPPIPSRGAPMSLPWNRGCRLGLLLVFFFTTNLYAQNNFVYTNDDVAGPNTVSGFAVASDGTLSLVLGSPFPTGGTGVGGGLLAVNRAAVCPATTLIYVSNAGSDDVSGFSVNPSSGSLTLVPGSPFAMDAVAHGIKISPDGKFLAAALQSINAVAMFRIATDGTLAPVAGSPFAGALVGALTSADINCSGRQLFAGTSGAATTVDVFDIATSGSLTPLPDSPFTPGFGDSSNVVLLNPNERLLFASNPLSKSVTVFSVASNGSLSPVAGSPFAAPGSFLPSGMAMDQAGKFLYVADGSVIYGYAVADGGALTSLPGSPFRTNPTNQSGRLLSLTAFPGKSCNQPPVCSAALATPSTAWPPNQQMVSISISGVSDPDGDPVTITPTDVSQDEPGAPGDATLAPLTVRADRDGASDGRVYTITFMASDGRGGTCTGAVKVCVPHDQGFDVPCVDQGPRYRSLP